MALATVKIYEKNTASATPTDLTSGNSNWGNTDAANITAASNPITANSYSYEKWQYFNVTSMGTSTSVKNLKFWVSAALTGSDLIKTNAHQTQGTYDTVKRTSQGTDQFPAGGPVNTASSYATQTPSYGNSSTPPTNPNVGITGTLTAELTATGTSDYIVHQVFVASGSTTGQSVTLYYQYDEVN